MCSPPRSFLELTTWSFDWWDIMILILHITMTTAAHSHPHPSEISSVFFGCRCQRRPNIPVLLKQWKRNRFHITSLFFLVSHQLKASMSWKKLNQMWWRMLFPCLVTLNVFFFHMQYFVRGMFLSFNTLPLFQHHTRCLKRVPRKPD